MLVASWHFLNKGQGTNLRLSGYRHGINLLALSRFELQSRLDGEYFEAFDDLAISICEQIVL